MRSRTALSAAALATIVSGGGAFAVAGTAAAAGTPVGSSPLAAVPMATRAAQSARIGINMQITVGSGTTKKVTAITGSGITSLTSARTVLDVAVPKLGVFDLRVAPPMLYLQLPAAARAAIPGGKSWVAVNLNGLASSKLGASLPQLQATQSSAQALALLAAATSGSVTKVGLAKIHGATTTAYKVTIDLAKLASVDAKLKKTVGTLGAATLPVEVWIDNQHRLRQVQYTLSVPARAGTPATSVRGTVDLYGFGVPVHVPAPPAAQVLTVSAQALAAAASAAAGAGAAG